MGVFQDNLRKIEEDKPKILDMYLNSVPRKKIAEYLAIPIGSISPLFYAAGILDPKYTEERTKRRRAKAVCRDPFKEITESSAYLYGYILGDGCLRLKHDKYNLNIYTNDRSHLLKLVSLFGLGEECIKVRKYSKTCDGYYVDIYDQNVTKSLMDLGIVCRKSTTGVNIPDFGENTRHFLRGLFDSDGCITYSNDNNSLRLYFFGHSSYMKKIYEDILQDGKWRDRKDGICEIVYYRKERIRELYHWLYGGATVYLDRKKERFDNFYAEHFI